jgi:glucose/arabinose dehydrogenase
MRHFSVFAVAALPFCTAPATAQSLRSDRVAQIPSPVYVTYAPGDFSRIFVVSQQGTVSIVRVPQNALVSTPFLTISVNYAGEQGLLGMAFHPNFAANGFVYVAYSEPGTSFEAIGRFTVSTANPDQVDPATFQTVLRFSHPAGNHNGGWLGFGSDGYLYMSSGDGAGSPQDLAGWGGKIIRIDVNGDDFPADAQRNYRIPATNPLVGTGNRAELWAWGLRNPWRCCVDSVTGDLYVADVGETTWEEVNFQPAGVGGLNYGWTCYEGNSHHADAAGCTDPALLHFPFLVYGHSQQIPPTNATGCSISGGEVYRGCAISGLDGTYFFSDYCSARIFSLQYDGAAISNFAERTAQLDPPGSLTIASVSGFGRDAFGEIYICDLGGEVFKILPANSPPDCNANGLADACDIASGASADADGNGVPDECDNGRPGDVDGDGDVDIVDLTLLLSAFGSCAGDATYNPDADVAANGCIDLNDLTLLLGNYGL